MADIREKMKVAHAAWTHGTELKAHLMDFSSFSPLFPLSLKDAHLVWGRFGRHGDVETFISMGSCPRLSWAHGVSTDFLEAFYERLAAVIPRNIVDGTVLVDDSYSVGEGAHMEWVSAPLHHQTEPLGLPVSRKKALGTAPANTV